MTKKTLLLLFVIVFLGFVLRFVDLTSFPPSLNWDEISIGYNAYSTLKTGHDEWGQFMPFFFKSYGEYKLPGQIYASVPAIYIFGLNDFAVRITPVVYGTLTVLLLFFLARRMFKNDGIGLLAALLLAISPWHIQLTRASFESSFSVFWVVMGVWFFVKAVDSEKLKLKWLFLSMIPLALSAYTYNSARIFTPLFLAVAFIYYRKLLLKRWQSVVWVVVFMAVLMVPLAQFTLSGQGSARYKLVSVTDDAGLIPRINEHRGNSTLPQPLPTLIHNKFTYVSYYVVTNYLAHFTPDFLFISGAPHKQHNIQNIGELYLFQAPFILIGLIFLFRKKKPFRWLLVYWILLVFIPVSFTNDSIPHALRTLIANPAYQIITAVGIYASFVYLNKKNKLTLTIFVCILALVVMISVGYYLSLYQNYRVMYSRDWQYGNKEVVEYIKAHQDEYDLITYSRTYGEPHMFTLFYLNYDPKMFYTSPNLNRFETRDWVRVLNFDKYYFPDLGDAGTRYEDVVAQNSGKKILFIGKPGDFPVSAKKIETVDFLNGQPAFEIVTNR
ncbi:MAG: hypothetical protein ACD_58C00313G0002 [uncultured bacterium]|nr:MAG: hypothetical protein ACD_58C00313G0002 [uncultured bacterium]